MSEKGSTKWSEMVIDWNGKMSSWKTTSMETKVVLFCMSYGL